MCATHIRRRRLDHQVCVGWNWYYKDRNVYEKVPQLFYFVVFFFHGFFGGAECVLVRLLHTTPRRFVIARVRASRKLESYKEVAAVALLFFSTANEIIFCFVFWCIRKLFWNGKRWRKEINHFWVRHICVSLSTWYEMLVKRLSFILFPSSFSRGVIYIEGLPIWRFSALQ